MTSLPQDSISTSYGTPVVITSGNVRKAASSGIRVASDKSANEGSRDFRVEDDRASELGAPTRFVDEATGKGSGGSSIGVPSGTNRGVTGGLRVSSGSFGVGSAGNNRAGVSSGSLGPFIPIIIDERQGPDEFGKYSFNFETGNGIIRQEKGAPQGKTGAVAQQGVWS